MPHCFWGEVVSTTAYILNRRTLNRSPSERLEGVTLEEAWTGNRPDVSHLPISGSLCFRHVPEQARRKLGDRAEQMVVLGYHPTSAYKLYDPRMKKIVISRDVLVDESKSWS